ncbi:hypothetical protein KAR91_40340 [Candidatus Pacearchaeota archaeon]|nr:hypothetical protein [Candidatus Pacearchaeota archaeon]
MQTIFHDPIVKAIEIDLIGDDVVFVNWDNTKTIEVEFEAASDEKDYGWHKIDATRDHIVITVAYINGDDDDLFESHQDIGYIKKQIRTEMKRLNNGG